jgi:hypothetical protein
VRLRRSRGWKNDRDGTVHLKDKLGNLDIQDRIMLAFGIDPYAGAKLGFLDRTRDQRAALGAVRIHELLSHSAELMLQNINHLWAVTPDLAGRKLGLFQLWDDCAETGSDDLITGGASARALVVSIIRARLTGASAYTLAELAELNAHRHSLATFAPYE